MRHESPGFHTSRMRGGTLTRFMCETCGVQHAGSIQPPAACRICTDDRQYLGARGQRWTDMASLGETRRVHIEDDAGLAGLTLTPAFAIDQRVLIVPAQNCRVMWESLSLVTPEAVEAIVSEGPVDCIALSHPHFYSAMAEWSDALGGIPILLHEADRDWVMRPSPQIEYWRGDQHEIAPGVTLLHCGGHFPGSAALHWQDAARPRGALMTGDALQVTADRAHVSFMHSYPNYIPLHPEAVIGMRRKLDWIAFDDVYGYARGRNIIGGARAAVDHSFERYLRAVGVARTG